MNSLKIFRFRNYGLINSLNVTKIFEIHYKSFSLTSKLCKDSKNQLTQIEERFKTLFPEEKGKESSPLKPLIDRLMSKPWLKFFGDLSKTIPIKETKEIKGLRNGMFRMAFDLSGFKAEEIHIIVSNNKLYIEATKEETTTDGAKACREFSFYYDLNTAVNQNSITAKLDSEGLLVIDGEVPKESLSGVKKV